VEGPGGTGRRSSPIKKLVLVAAMAAVVVWVVLLVYSLGGRLH
jgi:hypothetical protein